MKRFLSPFMLPILFFGAAIAVGAILLHHPFSTNGAGLSWIDAIFTATSATCVTGLAVVDTGTYFTPAGQAVILCLIQLGGIGIMTYASLVFYLWRRRVTLTDRMAVGQSLLHDPRFHLGHFLVRIIVWTLCIELAGAVFLYSSSPRMGIWESVFHSISAFCNAGFSTFPDSLMSFRDNLMVNIVVMALIILGGLGFSLLVECERVAVQRLQGKRTKFSWYAGVVGKTTFALIILGWLAVLAAEFIGYHHHDITWGQAALSSLFQAVTCRTAGFNTLDIGMMTNVTLLAFITLMFIGGSPGSCAGGIKTTTFRSLLAFAVARLRGREQAVVGKFALDRETINKALTLMLFAMGIVVLGTVLLSITEGGNVPHPESRGLLLEVLFETVSAFGTVGLTTGLTPNLTVAGKCIVTILMFIGRLGPILFLSALQGFHRRPHFRWPEETMLIG